MADTKDNPYTSSIASDREGDFAGSSWRVTYVTVLVAGVYTCVALIFFGIWFAFSQESGLGSARASGAAGRIALTSVFIGEVLFGIVLWSRKWSEIIVAIPPGLLLTYFFLHYLRTLWGRLADILFVHTIS